MKVSSFLIGCLLFPFVEVASSCSNTRQAVPMETYKINLNDPPEARWNHVFKPYLSSMPLVIDYAYQQLPKEVIPLLEVVMDDLDKYLGEYGEELKGISKFTGVNLGMLVGLNLAYELSRLSGDHQPNITGGNISPSEYIFGCTSIVAEDESGYVFHGRNLDWNLPNNIRNLTVQIDYYRGNQLLFHGITTVGYVGVLTGVSPNGFSVSINARESGGITLGNVLEALIVKNSKCPSHLLREVLGKAKSYAEAYDMLSLAHLVAPVYYIMAGTERDEGVVMSRDRNSNKHEQLLGHASYSSWYLMETNYDYWKNPPADDDRRSYAHKYIQSLGQTKASSEEGIMTVLSTWPVWNRFTTYTAIMDPAKPELKGYDIYDC